MRSTSLLRRPLRLLNKDTHLHELARTAQFRVDYLSQPRSPQYSRLASIGKIAARQSSSYDKDAVRLDETLMNAFSKNMSVGSAFSSSPQPLSSRADPNAAASRLIDRCSLFANSNDELITAFGLPLLSVNAPSSVFVFMNIFTLACVVVETTLACIKSSELPEAANAAQIHKKASRLISEAILARVATIESSNGNQGRLTDRMRFGMAGLSVRLVHALKAGDTSDQRLAAALWAHLPRKKAWREGWCEMRHLVRMVEWVRVHLALFDSLPAQSFLEGEWHFISILDPVAFPTTSREVIIELRAAKARREAEEAMDREALSNALGEDAQAGKR